jgi:eukaryotic-like serine/threonine-protein kinase
MVTSAPDDVSGRVPTRSDLTADVDPAHNRLKPLGFKLIGVLEEGSKSRDGASMNRRVIGPTSENELPPDMVTTEDIITEPGGAT